MAGLYALKELKLLKWKYNKKILKSQAFVFLFVKWNDKSHATQIFNL